MIRKLLIVSASGMIVAIAAFSGAWIAGGEGLRKDLSGRFENVWIDMDDGDDHGPRSVRDLAFDPAAPFIAKVPLRLDYVRADKPELHIEGPARVVDAITWDHGQLGLPPGTHHASGLHVTIRAPQLPPLDLRAPASANLRALNQDELRLTAAGAVSLDADGRAARVFVNADGAGKIDLDQLDAQDATVRVNGAGSLSLAATGVVDAEINGVGNIRLARKPRELRTRIHGIGSVDRDY